MIYSHKIINEKSYISYFSSFFCVGKVFDIYLSFQIDQTLLNSKFGDDNVQNETFTVFEQDGDHDLNQSAIVTITPTLENATTTNDYGKTFKSFFIRFLWKFYLVAFLR